MHDPSILSRPTLVRDWKPDRLQSGSLRSIVLHWTAGDYDSVSGAYHLCLTGSQAVMVHATHDLRANMHDVRVGAAQYAAHTYGRNSFSAGIAICAMRDATPSDFGSFPLTTVQIDALCAVTARLVSAYAIPLDAVRTHAEAAVEDGYFGAELADLRWDIARLAPSAQPLVPADAQRTGAHLRARIAELL